MNATTALVIERLADAMPSAPEEVRRAVARQAAADGAAIRGTDADEWAGWFNDLMQANGREAELVEHWNAILAYRANEGVHP